MSLFLRILINCNLFFTFIISAQIVQSQSLHYIYIEDERNWQAATLYCQTYYGTDLASIHSPNDTNEVNQLIPSTNNLPWIGLTDLNTPTEWQWSDGNTLDYTNWDVSRDAPTNAQKGQDCVAKNGDMLQWNPILCNYSHTFICNKPLHADYESDNTTYWKLLSDETRPISGYTYGTIEIKQQMHLKFEFIYRGSSSGATSTASKSNIFRIGLLPQNTLCQHNYPGFYTLNNELTILLSDKETCDSENDYIPTFTLQRNVTYTIVMKYNQNDVHIIANKQNYSDVINEIIYDGVRRNVTNPKMMNQLVDVIISDQIPSDVTILDLSITSYDATLSPTRMPTESPTNVPSTSPSNMPTKSPSKMPSTSPSNMPTKSPSQMPSTSPSNMPTTSPSKMPTTSPSQIPTTSPSQMPTTSPSTKSPSTIPTVSPSFDPLISPTDNPSISPTNMPSEAPSYRPTEEPTDSFPYAWSSIGEIQCGSSVNGTTSSTSANSIYYALVLDLNQNELVISSCQTDYNLRLKLWYYKRPYWYCCKTAYQISNCGEQQSSTFPNIQSALYYVELIGQQTWDYGNYHIAVTCSDTLSPTRSPSETPSNTPSEIPSITPSKYPTISPSLLPSVPPSKYPSFLPSVPPSKYPSNIPSISPTVYPSSIPTLSPLPTYHLDVTKSKVKTTEKDEGRIDISSVTIVQSRQHQHTAGKESMSIYIIITVLGIILIIVGLVILICVLYYKKQYKQKRKIEKSKHVVQLPLVSFPQNKHNNIKIVTNTTESATNETIQCSQKLKQNAPLDLSDEDIEDSNIEILYDVGPSTEGVINEMNDDEVRKWFREIVKLPRYYEMFVNNGLTSLNLISKLETLQDLQHIGIQKKGHQIVIMKCINSLQADDAQSEEETHFL